MSFVIGMSDAQVKPLICSSHRATMERLAFGLDGGWIEMEEQYEVSSGGKVVGPVSLDQLRRGVDAGMIPRDAQVRTPGNPTWQPVIDVLRLRAPPPAHPKSDVAPPADKPGRSMSDFLGYGPTKTGLTPPSDRYKNLHAVSSSLRTNGGLVKSLGSVVGALGAVGIVCGLSGIAGGMFAAGIGLMVLLVGVGLYSLGTMIAAMGEGLLALADIATNTAREP